MSLERNRGSNPNDWVTGVTWVWRTVLAAASGWSLYLILAGRSAADALDQLRYFTTLSTVAVFLFCAGSVVRPALVRSGAYRFEGRWTWLRGIATTMTVFTGIVFATLLGGSYPDVAGKIAHAFLPVAMLVDWLLVGSSHRRMPVWLPATWTAVLLPYLWLYCWDARHDGVAMYDFLNPLQPGWQGTAAALIAAFTVLGYLVWWLARLGSRR